jgi:hypothetical protein
LCGIFLFSCVGERFCSGSFSLPLFALIEPVTVAVHFQDMHLMRESIEQRADLSAQKLSKLFIAGNRA